MSHHHPQKLTENNQRKIVLAIWLNVLITVAQIIGGFVTGSLSILSDSLHNFSDVVALLICLLALWLSLKPQSLERTFGYKRAEIVAALVNILTLVAIGLLLIVEAFSRFGENNTIDSLWVIYLALFSFVINAFCGYILHDNKEKSLNIKAAYLHLLSDAITSLAIAIGGAVMLYTEAYWIDSVLTLFVSFYLLFVAYKALKDAIRIIMHFVPSGLDVKEIEQSILKLAPIKNVHHVHLWQINDNEIHFEAHLEFSKDARLSEIQKYLKEVRQILRKEFEIGHTVLQPELEAGHNTALVSDD